MKIFINCPKCNDPLLNVFQQTYHIKKCKKYPDHYFQSWSMDDEDQLYSATIQLYPYRHMWAFWSFAEKLYGVIADLSIPREDSDPYIENQPIPYFEPDFTHYDQLIIKMKAYSILI